MIVDWLPYTARLPQREADLARLLRYLFAGRVASAELNAHLRLAGPPQTRRLIQRHQPWGAEHRDAARDLADQLFEHARDAFPLEPQMPRQIYAHIVASFAPQSRRQNILGLVRDEAKAPMESDFSIANRIVYDVLDTMGIGEHFPMVIAVHDDRRHVHAHIVVGLHLRVWGQSLTAPRAGDSTIRAITRAADEVFKLPKPSRSLKARHATVVQGIDRSDDQQADRP